MGKIESNQWQEIVDSYLSGESLSSLAKRFNVTYGSITHGLKVRNVYDKSRSGHAGIKKAIKKTVCPKCQTEMPMLINGKSISFCYACGAKIFTRKELLLNDLATIIARTKFLPMNMRDETVALVRDVISAIEGGEVSVN